MTGPLEELERQLPGGTVITDVATSDNYRHDSASFCAAGSPLGVVRPTTVEQVQAVLRWASAHRVPVVPQGARTGLSGGANATDGALLLSMVRMNRTIEIDEVDQVAVVEAGVVNADLSRAVAGVGLFYPPDPSSWEMSTIGGNLATNAGGLCCVKYGVTADFVRGLEVVLATGEVMRVGRRTAKGVAGLDLTRLLVGSEGTHGVITQATLALRPTPEPALTMAAVFDKTADAMTAVARIMASGLRPSMMEYLDRASIRAVQAYRDMGL
ncbi:MAG: FAD-binding oxidoreductase, partial [Actinomycetes bacterium]